MSGGRDLRALPKTDLPGLREGSPTRSTPGSRTGDRIAQTVVSDEMRGRLEGMGLTVCACLAGGRGLIRGSGAPIPYVRRSMPGRLMQKRRISHE